MSSISVLSIQRAYSVYSSFLRIAFLNMLAYRLRYFTGVITYLLFVTVNYFIWNGVFSNQTSTEIKGFTLEEMVTYVVVGWVARSLYFSNIDVELNTLVRTGEVSTYLIRPVHFHQMMLWRAAGESLFRLLFFTIPISIVLLCIYPISLPPSTTHLFAFLFSTACSFFITAEINFLVGLLAFPLKSIDGIMRAKYFLLQLLSGLLLPITFFPEWAVAILAYLPFQSIAFVPLQIYLGKIEIDGIAAALGTQLVWCAILLFASIIGWRAAVRHLTLQGG